MQSFAKGEVTAEQAHEIGKKLAEELWGDKFQVVVTTHLNTRYFHNHFVLNSVSFIDGKRYSHTKKDIAMLRNVSDKLCEDYGLKVLKKEEKYDKYVASSSYKTIMRDSIDYAITAAKDYEQFIEILKNLDYTVTDDKGTISMKREPYKRNIRIERQFGKSYSIENIKKRILEMQLEYPYSPDSYLFAYRAYDRYNEWRQNEFQYKGKITCLIFKYDKLFGLGSKNTSKPQITKMTPELINAIKKMNEFSEQVRFVCKNKLETEEDVIEYKKSAYEKINPLKSKRENLWKKHKRAKTDEDKKAIEDEIVAISKKITPLAEDIRICDNILERAKKMRKYELHLKLENERKESEKDKNKQKKKDRGRER